MKKLASSVLLSIAMFMAALVGSAEPAVAAEPCEQCLEVWTPPECDDPNALHNWKMCGAPQLDTVTIEAAPGGGR